MDEAKCVETKTRYVEIVDEVLSLLIRIIVRPPVTANRQYLLRALLDRHDIWQRNTCGLTLLVLVLVAG